MDTQIIKLYGVPVYLRELRSGDLQVWHPFNRRARAIVERACRGKGVWNPAYNNWTVFCQFRLGVLQELNNYV